VIPRATRLFLKKWRNALKQAQGEKSSGSLESRQKLKEGKDDKRTYSCSEYWEGKVDIKKSREAERKQKDCTDYWEGEAACSELQGTGFWQAVYQLWEPRPRQLEDWRLSELKQDLVSEIHLYRSQRGKVVEQNLIYRQADEFFAKEGEQFKKEARRSQLRQIRKFLREYVKQFGKTRQMLKWQRQQTLQRLWNPRGAMGYILTEHEYKKRPVREDRLDTIIQIRLAKVLRLFLPKPGWEKVRRKVSDKKGKKKIYTRVLQRVEGVSRLTIARLIVLLYMVDDWATETEGGQLLISHTVGHKNKELTVSNVEQTLGRAGIK
jgi:hypothetical protein